MPCFRTKNSAAPVEYKKNKNEKTTIIMQPQSNQNEMRSKINNQQQHQNPQLDADSKGSIAIKGEEEKYLNEEPTSNSIASYLKEFLRRQADYAWLMAPYSRRVESDHFRNSVVHSTFPTTLSSEDFEYYIDMTFSDFSETLRATMKTLYIKNKNSPALEDITYVNDTDDTITATLVQILTQINDRNELEMIVGSVSFTRHLPKDYLLQQSFWRENKARIKTALQYIYGKEAEKELAHQNKTIIDV